MKHLRPGESCRPTRNEKNGGTLSAAELVKSKWSPPGNLLGRETSVGVRKGGNPRRRRRVLPPLAVTHGRAAALLGPKPAISAVNKRTHQFDCLKLKINRFKFNYLGTSPPGGTLFFFPKLFLICRHFLNEPSDGMKRLRPQPTLHPESFRESAFAFRRFELKSLHLMALK